MPDLITLQGLCLIHLKSVALLVREAQCCSSSDESSDSSLSSRGSSSIAEEDREMKMIEKNVVELLVKLRFWMNGKLFFLLNHNMEPWDICLVLLLITKYFVLVQIFCVGPKIYIHIVPVTNIFCQTKR